MATDDEIELLRGAYRAMAAGDLEPIRETIASIHAPCGLDLGARTPSETAISILAEVIAVRAGRSGESLQETSGPIHAEAAS
jgi:xanthine dehydrogenase accessory factor